MPKFIHTAYLNCFGVLPLGEEKCEARFHKIIYIVYNIYNPIITSIFIGVNLRQGS